MNFITKLKKEQLTSFLKKLFGNSFKSVSFNKINDEDTRMHAKLKLFGIPGNIAISFDDFNIIIGFIKIDEITLKKFGKTLKQKQLFINKNYRTFMHEMFGKNYLNALQKQFEKDLKTEQLIIKHKLTAIEEKYDFLNKEIKTKIANLEKELALLEEKKEKEVKILCEEFEQNKLENDAIIAEFKEKEILTKN